MDKNIMKLLAILTLLILIGGAWFLAKVDTIENNINKYCQVDSLTDGPGNLKIP